MEEIAYLIDNVSYQDILHYGMWAVVPAMLKFYARKIIKWKEDLDEKLVIINNLQRDHESTAKMLDEHLEIYRKRADYIDRKMDDIISATEKKNQILFAQLDKTEAKIQTIKDGNLAYIGDRLQQSMLFFIKQGFTNRLAQMNIHRMFEAYKAHDGNSWIAEMYEEYKQVPIEEDMEVLYEKNS